MNPIHYVKKRKSLLQEYKKLISERIRINKQLANIKNEMDGWDNALLSSE